MSFGVLNGVRVNGELVERAQSAQLLALLLANANTPVSVAVIEDALWDGQLLKSGSLHTAVSRLRSILPAGSLSRQGEAYVLEVARGAYDAFIFEDGVEAATLALAEGDNTAALGEVVAALALWNDHPFGGYGMGPAMVHEVARLVDLKAAASVIRLKALIASDRADAAVVQSAQPISEHPFHEGIRILHARALAMCGRQVEALRILSNFRTLLREEVGLDPSPDLRDLEQQLLDGETSSSSRPTSTSPQTATATTPSKSIPGEVSASGLETTPVRPNFAEPEKASAASFVSGGTRSPLRTRLVSMLDDCLRGNRQAIVVEGPAGIGKTTLLGDLSDVARSSGFRVVRGGFSPGARIPMLGWQPLLRRTRPDQSSDRGSESSSFEATAKSTDVLAAIDDLLNDGPAMLMLEDAHWADELSLQALSTMLLSGLGEGRPLYVVVSRRTETLGHSNSGWIERLVRDSSMESIELAPLDLIDLADVVSETLGQRPSRQLLSALLFSSDGNPLLAKTSATQLQRRGQLTAGADGLLSLANVAPSLGSHSSPETSANTPLPDSLTADVQAPYAEVIDELPPNTQDVLALLAILAGKAHVVDLALVGSRSAAAIIEAIVPAEERVLVHLSREIVDFDHDLVRRSILTRLSQSRRQLLHASVARALCEQQPDPASVSPERCALIANQLQLAGVLADRAETANWSYRAGMHAYDSSLWSEASRHLSHAGAHLDDPKTELALGTSQYYSLEPQARLTFQSAIGKAKAAGDVPTLVDAALGWHRQSANLGSPDLASAQELFVDLLQTPQLDRISRIRILAQIAEFSIESRGKVDGKVYGDQATSLIELSDPLELRFSVAFATGLVALTNLDLPNATRAFARACELDFPTATAVPQLRLAKALAVSGEFEGAVELVSPTLERAVYARKYWGELAVLFAERAAAKSACGDSKAAIGDAVSGLRWSQISGLRGAEQQSLLVAIFEAKLAGDTLQGVLGQPYTVPKRLEFAAGLLVPFDESLATKYDSIVKRGLETLPLDGSNLEPIGVLLEWAALHSRNDALRELAREIVTRTQAAGVECFGGWPRRTLDLSLALNA